MNPPIKSYLSGCCTGLDFKHSNAWAGNFEHVFIEPKREISQQLHRRVTGKFLNSKLKMKKLDWCIERCTESVQS